MHALFGIHWETERRTRDGRDGAEEENRLKKRKKERVRRRKR